MQKLEANKDAVGIFGFSFLEENAAMIKGLTMDGVEPTYDTIASGEYKVSRPLYVYVKKAHVGVIPGMAEFVAEYVSDKAISEEGYLSDKGLITLPGEDARMTAAAAAAMEVLKGDTLK